MYLFIFEGKKKKGVKGGKEGKGESFSNWGDNLLTVLVISRMRETIR